MKGFIIKAIGYITFLGAIHLLAAFSSGPKFDPFYMRFTSSKKSSFVFGNSRAARGIVADELNESLALQNNPIYNYSFTIGSSPYGPAYFNSIKQKFDSSKTDGIFIFSIDPWSISSSKEAPNDISNFRENDTYISKLKNAGKNRKPNFDYLLNFYPFGWGSILFPKTTRYLHDDGFLESFDHNSANERQKRINQTVKLYLNSHAKNYSISEVRIESLKKMIQYFNRFGNVFLVRLPIPSEMYTLEQDYCPKFDSIISNILTDSSCNYIDFMSEKANFEFNDGSHLNSKSARDFSYELSQILNSYMLNEVN